MFHIQCSKFLLRTIINIANLHHRMHQILIGRGDPGWTLERLYQKIKRVWSKKQVRWWGSEVIQIKFQILF